MHPIAIYELIKAWMEQDRQAERRRLAQAEMPRVPRAPASRRPPRKTWRDFVYPWIGGLRGDRGQPAESAIVASRRPALRGRCGPVG